MKRIELKREALRAVILPERGANCISLRYEPLGIKVLREHDYSEGEADNPFLYGMPILFPVNRISTGRFVFDGREYVFPINEPATGCHLHGELHRMPFAVLEQSEDRVVCLFHAEKGEYLGFPHAFDVQIEYRLTEDRLCHRVSVRNCSEERMPLFLGFHTTFLSRTENESSDTRVLVELSEEYERNMENYLPTGRKPEPDEVTKALASGTFDPLSLAISRHYRAGGNVMSLTHGGCGIEICYRVDPAYAFRLIYGRGEEGYISLEPQTCLADCANSPFGREEGGFICLEPHEKKEFYSEIVIKTKTQEEKYEDHKA